MSGKKILGITAEYNPFHNGHLYQMERAKELLHPSHTMIAMSGDFTQRGEPAIADKWTRSRWAVRCGADVVFELPFVFACNRAAVFAAGGVDLLASAGATHISFGCETDDPEELFGIAEALTDNSSRLEELARAHMADGWSYAKAYETAVRELVGGREADPLRKPNNILAVEYIKRIEDLRKRGLDIEALPVVRTGSGYDGINESEGFAGASAIRRMIEEDGAKGLCTKIQRFLPDQISAWVCDGEQLKALYRERKEAQQRFFHIIKGTLIRSSAEELSGIYCIGEGIENRFLSSIARADDLDGLIADVVSKRYTAAAVRRMLAYISLGIRGEEADRLTRSVKYLRVLAAGAGGRELLRAFGQEETPRVITNVNRQMPEAGTARDLLEMDIRAADMYNAICGNRLYDRSDRVVRPYIES